ncbi:MAG: hypothetical protein HYY12_05550 [Candidatus Methylomirabilis oxyfera]|nr:hypothetical protein [Candidatus Methylomirabilis oxyfera]
MFTDKVIPARHSGGRIALSCRVTARGKGLRAVREKIRRLGPTEADLTGAIRWVRGKRR